MSIIAPQRTTLPIGPKPLPIIGNALGFLGDQLSSLEALQRQYGNVFTVYFGPVPIVMLFGPEHVRYVLTEHPRNFTSREANRELIEAIGDGLLTLDGEAHREQRRLVQPAFHKKRVESYASVMAGYTEELIKEWHAGQQVDIATAMQTLTLRIVCRCLFNMELRAEVSAMGRAFNTTMENPSSLVERLLRLRLNVPFTAYGKRTRAKEHVDSVIYRLIEQRRKQKEDVGDVLSMLLNAQDEKGGFSDQQIRDHTMTFVAAGHETTSNALTFTFLLLSQHPAVLQKLLDELQRVLQGRTPTIQDIAKLPYTEWVLNESMRLYPPAWAIGRQAVEAFDLDGHHFPAGTMFMFSQWITHRLPEVWEEPLEFRPERWNPEHSQKIVPWSYFPFGGGPRICIGMPFAQLEAKIILATILQHYTPQVVSNYQLKLQTLITLRAKNGLPVTLKPIELCQV